jgi:hypothetical protein
MGEPKINQVMKTGTRKEKTDKNKIIYNLNVRHACAPPLPPPKKIKKRTQ